MWTSFAEETFSTTVRILSTQRYVGTRATQRAEAMALSSCVCGSWTQAVLAQ